MRFFDENADYSGDIDPKIIGAAHGRLSVRSVKIFADGEIACSPHLHDDPKIPQAP